MKSLLNTCILIAVTALLNVACTEHDTDTDATTETTVSTIVVPEDKITQLESEAAAGDSDAQYELAYLYENGLGVPKNEAKALALYQQAADNGHPAATTRLNGPGTSK